MNLYFSHGAEAVGPYLRNIIYEVADAAEAARLIAAKGFIQTQQAPGEIPNPDLPPPAEEEE